MGIYLVCIYGIIYEKNLARFSDLSHRRNLGNIASYMLLRRLFWFLANWLSLLLFSLVVFSFSRILLLTSCLPCSLFLVLTARRVSVLSRWFFIDRRWFFKNSRGLFIKSRWLFVNSWRVFWRDTNIYIFLLHFFFNLLGIVYLFPIAFLRIELRGLPITDPATHLNRTPRPIIHGLVGTSASTLPFHGNKLLDNGFELLKGT